MGYHTIRHILILAFLTLLSIGGRPSWGGAALDSVTRSASLWDTEHGLPSNKIAAIVKTPDGYLWLATAEGLIRFDGQRFSVFEHHTTPALPGSGVDDIVVDRHGVLWILARGRLIRRDGDIFIDVTRSLGRQHGDRIWVGDDGRAYVATDSYVFRCNSFTPARVGYARLPEVCYSFADLPNGEVLAGGSQGRLYSAKDVGVATAGGPSLLGNGSVTVAPDHKGGAWLACANGVFHKEGDLFTKLPTKVSLKDLAWMWATQDSTPNLLCDAEGTVWVQTGGTLNRSRNGVLIPCPSGDGAPSHLTRMGLDAGGRLWAVATTDSGNAVLYAWSGRKFEKIALNGPISAGVRIPVHTDIENGYWIGAQPGLLWSRVQTCRTFGTSDGLPADEITAAAATPDGLYAGTKGSGLYRLDGDRFIRANSAPADAHITSLTALAPGELWVGREGQEIALLARGMPRDFQSRYPVRKFSNIIRMAARDSKGVVWASDGVLLFRCDALGAARVEIHSNELLQGDVTRLFVDSQDNVWVAGSGGFIEVHDGKAIPYAPNPKLSGCRATSICEGGDGSIWIGFNGAGLARWKDGQVSILTAANGLPSDDISGMALDGNGRFWIGGSRGIYCVDESQLIAAADGRVAAADFTRMEKADGADGGALQSHDASCVTKDAQGKLWFVCEHGVIRVDPAQFGRTNVPTLLESVRVNGQRYPFTRSVVAEPGVGDLNIEYTAIRFAGSQRLRFEYRLRGYNTRWIDSGSGRSAAYMNLPPGAYTFDVRSYDAQSTTPLSYVSVSIVLRPYFYQTTWFRAGCTVAFLAALWVVLRLRTRLLVQRTRKLEVIVEARTADLLKAHETVANAYERLEEQKAELEMHNDLLQNTQAELEAQNDELQRAQAELEAQNIELIRMREELEYEKAALAEANIHLNSLAITDGLTGLTNHRGFQDQLEREWSRAMRYGQPLSLLLLDVDHFKQYNDTYGHPHGDKILKSIANILMDNCRDGDTPARYGGEEFVVVVPQTDEEGVAMLAERFRAAIEEFPWPDRKVTASIGVATYVQGVDNCRDLIEFADQALYSSKSQGRNRVTAYVQFAGSAAPRSR